MAAKKKVVKKGVKAKSKKYVSYKTIIEPEGYVPPKSYKFLGYCPICESLLSENDIPKGKSRIVDCNRCNTRFRINRLLKEISSTESNKKDHIERIKHIEEHYSEMITKPNDVPEELLPDMNDQM